MRLSGCRAVIGDRWGVTQAETTRSYPCDDFVPGPVMQVWPGVTVRTRPEHVWPWVAQVRLAPYSYDWLDNFGRRSPPDLRGLPDPVVGEAFTTALGGRRLGRILAVELGVGDNPSLDQRDAAQDLASTRSRPVLHIV